MPRLPPCDPISKPRLPTGERWAYELKLDGYRLQLHKFGRRVTIFSRNGHDWTERFPFLAGSLSSLPGSCIIDGELVATEGDGLAPFAAVHRAVHKRTEDNLVVFAFDLMAAAGRDITNETYLERRRRLKELIRRAATRPAVLFGSLHERPQAARRVQRAGPGGCRSQAARCALSSRGVWRLDQGQVPDVEGR